MLYKPLSTENLNYLDSITKSALDKVVKSKHWHNKSKIKDVAESIRTEINIHFRGNADFIELTQYLDYFYRRFEYLLLEYSVATNCNCCLSNSELIDKHKNFIDKYSGVLEHMHQDFEDIQYCLSKFNRLNIITDELKELESQVIKVFYENLNNNG